MAFKGRLCHPQLLHTCVHHDGSQLLVISDQNNLEVVTHLIRIPRTSVLYGKVLAELELLNHSLTFSGRLQTNGIRVCGSVAMAHSSTIT